MTQRSAVPPGQSVAEGSSHLTKYADAPTTVQTGKRSTASSVPRHRAPRHTVSQEQCLGRRATVSHSKTPTECTVHDVLSVLCNAVVVREATHACVSVVGVHRSVTTYRIIDPQPSFSRKLLCVHLSESLTNRHQLLQPLNSSLHCPHSLCNDVDRQHLPRKPRRGTGRLATTPDTKHSMSLRLEYQAKHEYLAT